MIARRSMEAASAAAVVLVGAVVAGGSLQHDVGWGQAGPGAGYFPLRIGLLLAATGAALFGRSLLSREPDGRLFVQREELARSLSVFLPTVAFGAVIPWLGCYLPMVLYLAWMARRGGYGWVRSVTAAVGATIAFFLVFEWWFQVPLAKGPIEDALGIY